MDLFGRVQSGFPPAALLTLGRGASAMFPFRRFLASAIIAALIGPGRDAVAEEPIADPGVSPGEPKTTEAVKPDWGFFRRADWVFDRADQLQADPSQIRLVQGELSTGEVTQPVDAIGTGQQLVGRDTGLGGDLPEFDFSDISQLIAPELPSSSASASRLNTPAEVDVVQDITQRVETGLATTAPIDIVPSSTFNLVTVPDAAETLVEIANTQVVRARRRSPIGFDARIRGFYEGQIYTTVDGGYVTPVRGDLDATLTKLDPQLIGSTEVIAGPYGLRFGSAFSFLNVSTIPTPRYAGGRERHVRLGTHIRANGGQMFNTATILGGSRDWGYFANVGFRKGSDYEAGNGLNIPSSYESLSLFSGLGWDLGEFTRTETKLSINRQGDTEYAGQFFDINELDHYGIGNSIIRDADRRGFGFRVDTWASETSFDGDTPTPGEQRDDFAVVQRVDAALINSVGVGNLPALPNGRAPVFRGDVDGDLVSAGIRAGVTKEYDAENSIGAGLDFRYVRQQINEQLDVSDFVGTDDPFSQIFTGLPEAEVFDPGAYVEISSGVTDYWRLAAGARLAFVTTQANPDALRPGSNFVDLQGDPIADLDVSDVLGSFYLSNDFDLSDTLRTRIGFGYAERTPNLTDRYSDGLFLAIIQSGFSRVIGDPTLSKERNWQLDVRVDKEYQYARTRFSAFHSWILDYVTYAANVIEDPTGSRLLQAVNTEHATLTGFEAYGEADLIEGIQTFAALSYLDGRDREIAQPLAGISPLESRIGLRFTDTLPENRYGVETGLRFVARQERLGTLRAVTDGLDPIPLETETPGFGVAYIRGYWRPTTRVSITGGIENLFDKNYFEHLNLRLPADPINGFGRTVALSPGFTPYFGVECNY